jgi:hypothetical protein
MEAPTCDVRAIVFAAPIGLPLPSAAVATRREDHLPPSSGREEILAPRITRACVLPPVDWDHAREHERESKFCFEIGNET